MVRPIPFGLMVILLAGLGWIIFVWQPDRHQSIKLAPVPQGGDFTLESWRGPVHLTDFRGQVVLLYFGYTRCPDVCPTNLGYIALALQQLAPKEQTRVQVLFVSVDPERDSVQQLKIYANFFHPQVLGVTGTPDQVAQAAQQYGAAYRKVASKSAVGYLVDHSAYTYLIDGRGQLRKTLNHATPPEQIADAVRGLMQ
jgi:protein SCO1